MAGVVSGYLSPGRDNGFGIWVRHDKAGGAFVGDCGFWLRDDGEGIAVRAVLDKACWGRGLSGEGARGRVAEGVRAGGRMPEVEACLEAVQRVSLAVILDGRRPHALRDCMAGQQVGTRIG